MSYGRISQVIKAMVYMTVKDPRSMRYLWPWLTTLGKRNNILSDGVPWITFRAKEWLDEFLKVERRVFEYGSGGSTVYFARHTRQLISVEYDEQWHVMVAEELAKNNLTDHCEYRLVKPREVGDDEPSPQKEIHYRSYRKMFQGLDFEAYARAIDEYPNASFDLVVVDARARNACVQHAIPKVKPGGYLMLDNADRPAYKPAIRMLSPYRLLNFYGLGPYGAGPRGTSLWQID